jgi:hypothetical protein
MKIREILELTQTEPLATIAKERLTIGEKTAREALKKAGCYSISGKKGWYYDGDESVLEQSIYDFVSPRKIVRKEINSAKKEVSATAEKAKANVTTKELTLQPTNERTNKRKNELSNVVRKRASFDIDVELLRELKVQAALRDRNIYEMVETAIRQYLAGLK